MTKLTETNTFYFITAALRCQSLSVTTFTPLSLHYHTTITIDVTININVYRDVSRQLIVIVIGYSILLVRIIYTITTHVETRSNLS